MLDPRSTNRPAQNRARQRGSSAKLILQTMMVASVGWMMSKVATGAARGAVPQPYRPRAAALRPDAGAKIAKPAARAGQPAGARTQPGDPKTDGSGVIFTAKRVWDEIGKDRVLSVAGGLTFFALLALFPAITALVSIFGLFADPSQVVNYLGNLTSLLPEQAATILIDQAKAISAASSANLSLAAVVALALALWSANGGTKALIEALNVAYGVPEERGFVRLTAMSLGATLCTIATGLVLISVVAVLPKVLDYLWLSGFAEKLLLWGRWPAIFVVLLGLLALAYRFAPNRTDAEWRWISPGAVLAAVGLVAFSLLFNWYVQNLGNYNETYGSLGAVVALMTWMWLSATLVLVGAELNSELDRQSMSASKKGPVAAPANASR